MDEDLSFGRWVKVRRVALGLTQAMLAERTGYSTVTIRKIESDDLQPSRQIADKLAEALMLTPEERSAFIRRGRSGAGAAYPSPLQITPPSSRLASVTASAPLPPFLAEQLSSATSPAVFVGRERELAELTAALETARGGKGQILFVIGGAGRGKTMLVQEFARQAQAADAELLVVSGYGNVHTGVGDPYLPFREALTMLTGEVEAQWAGGLITADHARRLWAAMPVTIPALVEHAPDLVGAFVPGNGLCERAATFAPADASWCKQLATLTSADAGVKLEQPRIFAQYTAALAAIARQRPLLLILEDLHWVDSASSSLLFYLSREVSRSRILIVGTYRPDELALSRGEFQHPLAGILSELKRRHGDIWLDLGDLAPAEGRRFVEAYLDTQPNRLGPAFREALFQRTGGHALFTVELLREMRERGDLRQDADNQWMEGPAIDWNKLPARVEGVIEKRIQRLEQELQTILTIASVEGETFTAEVVARVQQLNERGLVQQLSRELDRRHRLVTAQILAWLGQQRLSLYRFRHQLFQHYLYHNLAASERAYLHEAVGSALESLHADQSEQVAVQLAHHFQQAGVTEKAVTYLLQAGVRAGRLSAHQEAIQHLRQGLALLASIPDTPQCTRLELAFQIALGHAMTAIKGYSASETGKAYHRAHELALQVEETLQIFAALHGLHAYHFSRAELHTARAVAEQMLHLAQNQPEPILRVSAHHVLGNTPLFLGEFGVARAHLEQGILLYHPQHHPSYVLLCGQDEGVASLANLAWILWFLGYPDQALQRGHEALTLAQTLAHPFSLAIALAFVASLHLLRQEVQVAQRQAEALIRLATEQEFSLEWAIGTFARGLALVRQEELEGVAQMQSGLSAWPATGAEIHKSYMLAGLSEGYAKAGQIDQGLNLLVEALAQVEKTEERFWEAEIYRLKGELLLQERELGGSRQDDTDAETCFRQAIEIAQRQGAKSLELRATVSMGRLWQRQGKKAEARQVLAEIFSWFTEGFDTVELFEAKTLLEELSA
jgi:predicted ATPase/transcriptional regulator with XRE-family HTH domain